MIGRGSGYIQNAYRAEWDCLKRRLIQAHGAERAAAILAGQDVKTNTDLLRWRDLGRRPAA